jgi:hypothetical protein
MSQTVKNVLKWLGRAVIAAAGVILIIASVAAHSPKLVASIVTGLAAIGLAVYASLRGLDGTTRADEETQALLGIIELETWYDWLVGIAVIVICILVWIFA